MCGEIWLEVLLVGGGMRIHGQTEAQSIIGFREKKEKVGEWVKKGNDIMVGLREEKFGKRRRNERTTNTTTFLLKLWWALSFSIFHSLFQFPTTKHSHSSCNYYPLTIGTSPKDQYYDATNACLPPFAFLFMVAQIYIYICVCHF